MTQDDFDKMHAAILGGIFKATNEELKDLMKKQLFEVISRFNRIQKDAGNEINHNPHQYMEV